MKDYIGTKFIKAELKTYGEYCLIKYGNQNHFDKDTGLDNDKEGYIVEYENNYISWSPKEVFEEAYKSDCNLTFGMAIELMKKGCKVAREGWNGKDMYIYLCKNPIVESDDYYLALPTIIMKTAKHELCVGWLASQADMLSNDWVIVE